MKRLVALLAVVACATVSHDPREAAHYAPINLTGPLPYDSIGLMVVNSAELPMPAEFRDSLATVFRSCLESRGLQVSAATYSSGRRFYAATNEENLDNTAAAAYAKDRGVPGVMVVQITEIRRPSRASDYRRQRPYNRSVDSAFYANYLPIPGGISMDARIVDRDAAASIWARRASAEVVGEELRSVRHEDILEARIGASGSTVERSWRGLYADIDLGGTVCGMVKSLSAAH